jgi:ribosomal protein S28E/S33
MTEPLVTVSGRVTLEKFEYPREILDREVERVQSMIKARRFFGTQMEDAALDVKLAKVSHIVSKLAFHGAALMVTVEVLDTDKGRDLARICQRAVDFPDLFEVRWGLVGHGTTVGLDKPTIQDDYLLGQVAWWAEAKNEAKDAMSDQETEHERTLRKSAEVGAQSIREEEDERILKKLEERASALPRTEGGRIDLDRLITCSNLLPEPGGEVVRELAEHYRGLEKRIEELSEILPEQLLGKKVYVLCEDTDMTMRSQPWPNGEAVLTEEEAEKWAAEDEGCDKRFYTVTVRRKS